MVAISNLLLRKLAALEIPDCGCGGESLPACERFGGESCATDDKPCDCPMVPPPPCEHVLAADHGVTLEVWAFRLWAADPAEYAEPPLPPGRMGSQEVGARVAVMERRHGPNRNVSRYAIRHPGDVARDGRQVGEVDIGCERLRNGAVHETELRVYRSGESAGFVAQSVAIWDEFALSRLEAARRIASRHKAKKRKRAA